MAIHRLTLAAFHQAGDPTCYPEQLRDGLQPYAPLKLYVTAAPRDAMRTMREQLQAQGIDFRPGGNMATIPLDQMGTPDGEITAAIPLSDREFDAKMEAEQAHRTQLSADSPFKRLSREAIRQWLGTERFKRLVPPVASGGEQEHDLFDGVTGGEW